MALTPEVPRDTEGNGVGVLYLLHFDRALGDPERPRMSARHYVGWAKDGGLEERLEKHARGEGAKITRAARDRGIGWTVTLLGDGDRGEERRIKRNGHFERRCSVCNVKVPAVRGLGR